MPGDEQDAAFMCAYCSDCCGMLSILKWARLESELPAEVQETLHRHEEAGTTDDPAKTPSSALSLSHASFACPASYGHPRSVGWRTLGSLDHH